MASPRSRSKRNPSAPPEPLIKVTLESLKGITLKTRDRCSEQSAFIDISELCKGEIHQKAKCPRVPHVTAAVSFSGSAADMQVGSSSLCPRTGNLLVESEPAYLLSIPETKSVAPEGCSESFPLVAHWDGGEGEGGSSRMGPTRKPHLTIRLPSRDPNLPSLSLEQMNRDCNVVRGPNFAPELQDSDLSSESGEEGVSRQGNLKSFDDGSDARGPSVVWSASGSGMPEIIELNVSLMVGTEESHVASTDGMESPSPLSTSSSSWGEKHAPQEGVAYLVFFGHDKVSTTMDLPIKRHPSQKLVEFPEGEPAVTLDEEAMLRIRVDVLPEGKEEEPKTDTIYSKSLLDSFVGRKRLEPILQQLRHESDQNQQMEEKKEEAKAAVHKAPEEPTPSGLGFCGGDTSFLTILKELTEAVKHCDDGGVYVQSGDSVASTLDTAASLGI